MSCLISLIWIVTIGAVAGLSFFAAGLVLCLTVIGIPLGKQLFKFAKLAFLPFGQEVDTNFFEHPIANAIWALLGGIEIALAFLAMGLVFCITVIGAPLGVQAFKFAKLSLFPFGAEVG